MKTRPSARQCFDACLNTALDERAPGRRRRRFRRDSPTFFRSVTCTRRPWTDECEPSYRTVRAGRVYVSHAASSSKCSRSQRRNHRSSAILINTGIRNHPGSCTMAVACGSLRPLQAWFPPSLLSLRPCQPASRAVASRQYAPSSASPAGPHPQQRAPGARRGRRAP